jgi:hypothetical protein
MQTDIRLQYNQALDESHHGHPTVVETVHARARGRPSIAIDPDFLRWAHSHRSTSAISQFLGVSRRTVRNALINYGIALPQSSPFVYYDPVSEGDAIQSTNLDSTQTKLNQQEVAEDDILNDNITFLPSQQFASDILQSSQAPSLRTSPLSDDQLDHLILQLRGHYTRAGITMLHGMLRRLLGYHISREAIRQSLLRIDPVRRVFERIRIRRRTYSVPGPNSLWHHDGQHGTFYSDDIIIY